jgi:hypothetical protein
MERSPLDLTSNLRKFSEASIVDLTEDEIQLIEEDHPPSKKIKQNIQDDQEPLHEKRPSSYRSHPSKTLKENISKAQSQGLRLIQQKYHVEDSLEREFIILGVNGNVYNTKISCRPSCNCENNKSGANRTHCEHICFVFLKIFRLSASDARIFQKDLLTTELKSILNSFTSVPPSVLADPTVTEKYLEIMGTERSRKVKKTVNQKKIEGDCLVCFEPLDSSEDLVYCKYSCGNNIHKKCFERWKETRKEESCEVFSYFLLSSLILVKMCAL